ncbi:hypothetical protein D3C83_08640 [compost metagenome]
MNPTTRCRRYGEVRISTTNPTSSRLNRPANSFQFMPPRNRMPMAITVITTKAPKSGSRSSSHPTPIITTNIGRKPLRKLAMCAAFLAV